MNVDEMFETFTMVFMDVTTRGAELDLLWEKTIVPIHMQADDDAKIMANIDTLMSSDKKANYYFGAIQYYYENDKDMHKALEWALAGEAANPKAPYYVVWEARVRLKMGDKEGAIKAAERGVQLSRDQKDAEYERLNQMVLDKAKS
jgi:tetratricopeptide (TPR) repeat protein